MTKFKLSLLLFLNTIASSVFCAHKVIKCSELITDADREAITNNPAGTVVIVDEETKERRYFSTRAIALSSVKDESGEVVKFCFNPGCKAAIVAHRCGRCRSALYCSVGCQTKDWPFHKHECPIDKAFKDLKN